MVSNSQTGIVWLNSESDPPTKETPQENLARCFRPISICLKIFGIDIQWKQQPSSAYQYLLRLMCIFWSIVNVLVATGIAIQLSVVIQNLNVANHTTTMESLRSSKPGNLISSIVESTFLYAALALATWKHGQQLVESFKQIETCNSTDQEAYRKLRIGTLIATFVAIFSVIT